MVLPGIIPARAGFTVTYLMVDLYHTDHPRSRGVYIRPAMIIRLAVGSSPLARGLHLGVRTYPF